MKRLHQKLSPSFILFSVLFFADAKGISRSKQEIKINQELSQTKTFLSKTRNEVTVLRAMLNSLDQNLSKKNNLYLNFVRTLERFEKKISLLKKEHRQKQQLLSKNLQDYQLKIQSLLLYEEEAETEEEVMLHALTLRELNYKYNELEKVKKEYKKSKQIIAELESKTSHLRNKEEELLSLVHDLEDEKQITLSKTKKIESNGKDLSLKYKTLLSKSYAEKKKRYLRQQKRRRSLFFLESIPLKDYQLLTEKKKGVNFRYNRSQPIYAVNGGKVLYSGDLGNFGKIIMISHNKDIRSVYLGHIDLNVSNQQRVKAGQVIGQVKLSDDSKNKLYFELRKKEKKLKTKNYIASLFKRKG